MNPGLLFLIPFLFRVTVNMFNKRAWNYTGLYRKEPLWVSDTVLFVEFLLFVIGVATLTGPHAHR